jgi:hypothetical protein
LNEVSKKNSTKRNCFMAVLCEILPFSVLSILVLFLQPKIAAEKVIDFLARKTHVNLARDWILSNSSSILESRKVLCRSDKLVGRFAVECDEGTKKFSFSINSFCS